MIFPMHEDCKRALAYKANYCSMLFDNLCISVSIQIAYIYNVQYICECGTGLTTFHFTVIEYNEIRN